jgi:hypothetical protein
VRVLGNRVLRRKFGPNGGSNGRPEKIGNAELHKLYFSLHLIGEGKVAPVL